MANWHKLASLVHPLNISVYLSILIMHLLIQGFHSSWHQGNSVQPKDLIGEPAFTCKYWCVFIKNCVFPLWWQICQVTNLPSGGSWVNFVLMEEGNMRKASTYTGRPSVPKSSKNTILDEHPVQASRNDPMLWAWRDGRMLDVSKWGREEVGYRFPCLTTISHC